MNILIYGIGLFLIWFACFVELSMWIDRKYDRVDGAIINMGITGIILLLINLIL